MLKVLKELSTGPQLKISRSCVRPTSSSGSSDSECINPDQCFSFDYQKTRDGVPGFEIETSDGGAFWAPVAHRICSGKSDIYIFGS